MAISKEDLFSLMDLAMWHAYGVDHGYKNQKSVEEQHKEIIQKLYDEYKVRRKRK